jgi:hypothetical protein
MDELPEEPGSLGYYLKMLKPTIVIFFYPAALFVLIPDLIASNFFFWAIWMAAKGATLAPYEVCHFIFFGLTAISSLLRLGFLEGFFTLAGAFACAVAYAGLPLILAARYVSRKDALGAGAYLSFLAVALHNLSSYVGVTAWQAEYYSGPDGLLRASMQHDWYSLLSFIGAPDSYPRLFYAFQFLADAAAVLALALLAIFIFLKIKELTDKEREEGEMEDWERLAESSLKKAAPKEPGKGKQ